MAHMYMFKWAFQLFFQMNWCLLSRVKLLHQVTEFDARSAVERIWVLSGGVLANIAVVPWLSNRMCLHHMPAC